MESLKTVILLFLVGTIGVRYPQVLGGTAVSSINISLNIGDVKRITLDSSLNYTFNVDAITSWKNNKTAFIIQLHTQAHNLSLQYDPSICYNEDDPLECMAVGRNIGLVQLLLSQTIYKFTAQVKCYDQSSRCPTENVRVLVAVIGIDNNYPIPGGCTKTSSLYIEPELTAIHGTHSTTVGFQAADVGFNPQITYNLPECDDNSQYITKLEYTIYRSCMSTDDFSLDGMFEAITSMLKVGSDAQSYHDLKHSDIKRVLFDSHNGRGVVYNVVAKDKRTGVTSAYVPAVSYGCDFATGECTSTIPPVNIACGVILCLLGLFTCLLSMRFFHVEVIVVNIIIFTYIMYLILLAVTSWNQNDIIGCSFGLAVVISLLLFVLWFFSGASLPIVLISGTMMGFLLSATVMYTPVGYIISVFEVSYVYALLLVCGTTIFLLMFIVVPAILSGVCKEMPTCLFDVPVVLNITSTSLIGSYTVIFGISIFKFTQLSDIVLRVVKNAAVPGLLAMNGPGCPFQMLDVILCCVWAVLLVLGLVTQAVLLIVQETRFYKKQGQQNRQQVGRHGPDVLRIRYTGFPSRSLFRRLIDQPERPARVVRRTRRSDSTTRPLLSPNNSMVVRAAYGSVNT